MGEPDLKTIEGAVNRAKVDHAHKAGEPSAADVLANDETLRPFSIRLSAKEIMTLKSVARLKGISTSDLVRSMLTQSLAETINEPAKPIDQRVAAVAMEQIRQVLVWAVNAPPEGVNDTVQPPLPRVGVSRGGL